LLLQDLADRTTSLCFNDSNETLNPNETFPINIQKTEYVGILKKMIKAENTPRLDHATASGLEVLVSDSVLINDLASKQSPTDGTPLPLGESAP
jgi:hypothetical protein